MNISPYDSELQLDIPKIAAEELNETEEEKRKKLDVLRQTITADDSFLVMFLRCSKYDVKKAKKKLRNYLKIKEESKFFENRDPLSDKISTILQAGIILPLGHDDSGRMVFFFRCGLVDISVMSLFDLAVIAHMLVDLCLEKDEMTQVCGLTVLYDLKQFGWRHAMLLDVGTMREFMSSWVDSYPLRLKGFHYYRHPRIFYPLFVALKPFIKTKLLDRVHFHGDSLESIEEFVPKRILPKDCGGTGKSTEELQRYWQNQLIENREWLINQSHHRTMLLGDQTEEGS